MAIGRGSFEVWHLSEDGWEEGVEPAPSGTLMTLYCFDKPQGGRLGSEKWSRLSWASGDKESLQGAIALHGSAPRGKAAPVSQR